MQTFVFISDSNRLFPSLSHVIYLDVDSLVLHDISELWNEVVSSDELITATSMLVI